MFSKTVFLDMETMERVCCNMLIPRDNTILRLMLYTLYSGFAKKNELSIFPTIHATKNRQGGRRLGCGPGPE